MRIRVRIIGKNKKSPANGGFLFAQDMSKYN